MASQPTEDSAKHTEPSLPTVSAAPSPLPDVLPDNLLLDMLAEFVRSERVAAAFSPAQRTSLEFAFACGALPASPGLLRNIFRLPDPEKQSKLLTLLNILLSQSRDSTLTKYMEYFGRWSEYARIHDFVALPPRATASQQAIDKWNDDFSVFIMDEYEAAASGGRRASRTTPLQPGTFDQCWSGIQFVVVQIFGRPGLQIPLLRAAKRAYRQQFAKPVKKAIPVTGAVIIALLKAKEHYGYEWLNITVDVIVILYCTAGRWNCVNQCDRDRTFSCPSSGHVPANPQDSYSLFYFFNRKNKKGLTFCTTPFLSDAAACPRECFLRLHALMPKKLTLIPWISKKRTGPYDFIVERPIKRSCTYRQFLKLFRAAFSIAKVPSPFDDNAVPAPSEWSLHGPRRGFVTNARDLSDKTSYPLSQELVAFHCGFSLQSAECQMGYNQVNPAGHARVLKSFFDQTLSQSS